MGIGGMLGFGSLVGGGYHLWLASKLRNIPKLWTAKDEMQEKLNNIEPRIMKVLHRVEIDAMQKYATKSEMTTAIEKLDAHMKDLGEKLDRLIETRGAN